MLAMRTQDVKAMYEKYPYPSPIIGESLIMDVANMIGFLWPEDNLSKKKILDAGCGTGHRLLGVAQRYALTDCLGIDMTTASLDVARKLAQKHHLSNVRFQEADLLNLHLTEQFDLIVSTGVIHHLENPEQGLWNLVRCLSSEGIIILWHYHAIGESRRLWERELALNLWDRSTMSYAEGLEIIEQLGIHLSKDQYGTAASQRDNKDVSHRLIDVDAYLHPIVRAYRFHDAIEMFRQCSLDWVAVNSINMEKTSKMIDLRQVSDEDVRFFCIRDEELFQSALLRERYGQLPNPAKLTIIELLMKPTGFTIMAGKEDTYTRLDSRIQGNVLHLQD